MPTSSKPMGVLGRHSSDQKHNPFSALATAVRQSVKAAKRKLPPHDDPDYDDGDEWKRARKGSKSVGKAPHKQLPHKLPNKKPENNSKSVFTGSIKKPHRFHPGHSGTLTDKVVPKEHRVAVQETVCGQADQRCGTKF